MARGMLPWVRVSTIHLYKELNCLGVSDGPALAVMVSGGQTSRHDFHRISFDQSNLFYLATPGIC